MLVSQKCQYALRAIFELARQAGQGPVKIAEIAESQAIPARFLEVILNQLKQGGFVESKRGNDGGYLLARPASQLTVGDIIRFIQGPLGPVECVTETIRSSCPLRGGCVFLPVWEKVREAMASVYDGITFQDLVDKANQKEERAPSYAI